MVYYCHPIRNNPVNIHPIVHCYQQSVSKDGSDIMTELAIDDVGIERNLNCKNLVCKITNIDVGIIPE